MKITVLTEIISTHSGSRAPLDLAEHLSLNNKVTLLAFDFLTDYKTKKRLEEKGIGVVLAKIPHIPLGKFWAALKFIPYLTGQDLISFHSSLPSLIAAKLSGATIIRTYYGTQLDAYLERVLPNNKPSIKERFLNYIGNKIILFIGKISFALSDHTIGISKYTAWEAKRLFGQKIPFIYLGSNLPVSHFSLRPSHFITIMSVSRITPYKGFHLLIEAFKEAGGKVPNLKLIIAGSAPNLSYLNYLRDLSKGQNIQILTDVSDYKLSLLYQECDIYATFDRYLFFGLPIVEAAHFAKPSLAYDFSAAGEVICHAQTGFVAKSIQEFTSFLIKLAKNQTLREKLGRKAEKFTRKEFLWPKIANEYEKLFRKVLAKKRATKIFPKIVTIAALSISLIFGLPHILIPYLLGGTQYQPLAVNNVPLANHEEAFVFGAQVQDVCDGHFLSGDPALFETKNQAQAFYILPQLLAGLVACPFKSIALPFVLGDFLLPPLIFLAVYFFLFQLTKEKILGILGGIMILTTARLFQFIPPLNWEMLKTIWDIFSIEGSETVFLEFSRFPHPQLSFLILTAHLYFLYSALKKYTKTSVFLASLSLGLLFYTYFYYWTFALFGEAVLFLSFLLQRDRTRIKVLSWNLFFGLILSIPYWFLFLNFKLAANANDILQRGGLEIGRIGNVMRSAQYLFFSLIFFKLIKNKSLSFWFLLSFLLGGVLALNIQLLTGFTIQSWHWTLRALNPLSVIMLVFLFHQLLQRQIRKNRLLRLMIILLTLTFFAQAFLLQATASKNTYRGFTLSQSQIEAFNWLNKNTPKDSVIASPSFETNSLLPIYTHNNIFLPLGAITSATNLEITERLLLTYKIFGLDRKALDGLLSYSGTSMGNCLETDICLVDFRFWEKQLVTELYHMKYLTKNESLNSWSVRYEIPKNDQDAILKDYDLIILPDYQISYRLDYLYYGPNEKKIKTIDFAQNPNLKEVYQNQDVQIYKISI